MDKVEVHKVCLDCREGLPLSEFNKRRSSKDGLHYYCRQCQSRRTGASRAKPENRKKANEKSVLWRKENPERKKKQGEDWRNALKNETLLHYGNSVIVCSCPGCTETHSIFLTIDHIEGGGNAHRRELKIQSGTNFYLWLKRTGWPPGFQVLCFNCNHAKHALGKCPHTR